MSICKLHIKTAPLVGGGRGAEPAALTRRATAALCLEPAVGGRSSCTHSTVPASLPPPHGTEKSPPHPLPLPGIKQKYLLRRWAHASGSVGGPPQCQWGSSGAGSGAAAVGLSQEVVRTVQKGHNSERSVSNHLTAPSPAPQIGTGMRAGGGGGRESGGCGDTPMGLHPTPGISKVLSALGWGVQDPPRECHAELRVQPPSGALLLWGRGGLHTHSPHLAPLRPGRSRDCLYAPTALSNEKGSNASSAPPLPNTHRGGQGKGRTFQISPKGLWKRTRTVGAPRDTLHPWVLRCTEPKRLQPRPKPPTAP